MSSLRRPGGGAQSPQPAAPPAPAVEPELARGMARAAAGLDWDGMGADAVAKAKLCLLDFFSCALASRGLPWSRQAVAVAAFGEGVDSPAGAGRHASIIGTTRTAAAPDAAFANAVLGHGLVRDDMHLGSVSHLGVVVLPPLLALAETGAVTGRDLLAGALAGYQAGGELGRAIMDVETARIFRPTGAVGAVAGAAAGARLLGLGAVQAAHAIAIAANTAAGYNEWAATGGSEMFFQVGFAARNAVTAVQLARAGARASASALDGSAGMLAAFHKRATPSSEDRPRRAEILDVFFKPVPACNFAQSAAQAARELATRHDLDCAAVARVRVRVPLAAAAYPGCDCAGPFEHILQAKMSIQYNVAAALATRAHEEASYRPLEQPQIVRLAARVAVEVDDALTRAFPARQGAEVIVATNAGETLRCAAADVVPAGPEHVERRFMQAAAAALGNDRAERLAALIERLEALPDAGELASATRSAR